MSQWETHKGRSNTSFNMMAQGTVVANTINENKTWMHQHAQLCWRCQK
jgi:hypothetical protein